jgi:hypothetical protein
MYFLNRIVEHFRKPTAKSNLAESDKLFVPPGHFYSPIPNPEELRNDEAVIWGPMPREIAGVDLNEEGQLALIDQFSEFYNEMPFMEQKVEGCRYFFENPAYSYSDAIILYCMIRYARPGRIIEVGSGYSSCVSLDTNDLFFNGEIETTFIEPYPDLFYSLITEEDKRSITVTSKRLQDIPLALFSTLQAGDILFIDSTHVCKVNSDVNYIYFKILPILKDGVFIHFHDIFYPFEYPKSWAFEGRAWNEAYMLRAFLEYNDAFKIIFFNTYLEYFHEDLFRQYLPLCLRNRGGSIWLQKRDTG